jgi:hypothetical protein
VILRRRSILASDGRVTACLERGRARLRLVVGPPFRHRDDPWRYQVQPGQEALGLAPGAVLERDAGEP